MIVTTDDYLIVSATYSLQLHVFTWSGEDVITLTLPTIPKDWKNSLILGVWLGDKNIIHVEIFNRDTDVRMFVLYKAQM